MDSELILINELPTTSRFPRCRLCNDLVSCTSLFNPHIRDPSRETSRKSQLTISARDRNRH